MKQLDKEKELEYFEEFIFYIDDTLEEIQKNAQEQGFNLNLSLASLKDLALYIRNNKIVNDKEDIDNFFNSWVYLGEVFRLHAKGAKWAVELEHPNYATYGHYYLTGYDDNGSEFVPILLVNNFSLGEGRLDNDFFRRIVDMELSPE